MPGLYRNHPDTREGKYPVLLRRDGTVPEWEHFCLGARDPAAPTAIRAYADECERRKMDPEYVRDLLAMALSWEEQQQDESERWARSEAATNPHDKQLPWGFADPPAKKADPDGPRHRTDDPDVLAFPNTLAEYRAKVRAEAFEEAARMAVAWAGPKHPEVDILSSRSGMGEALAACFTRVAAAETVTSRSPRIGRSA